MLHHSGVFIIKKYESITQQQRMLLYIGQSVSLLINQLSIIIMYVSFMKHVLFSHKISTFDVHIDNFVTSWFPW